jgi:hypothetical protein
MQLFQEELRQMIPVIGLNNLILEYYDYKIYPSEQGAQQWIYEDVISDLHWNKQFSVGDIVVQRKVDGQDRKYYFVMASPDDLMNLMHCQRS